MIELEVGKSYKSYSFSLTSEAYYCLYVSEKGAVFKYGLQEFYLDKTQIEERKFRQWMPPVVHKRWVCWWKNNNGVMNCTVSIKHPSEHQWLYPIIHSQEVTYEIPEGGT